MLRLLRTLEEASAAAAASPLAPADAPASVGWTVGAFRTLLLDLFRRESGKVS
jgi:hypothetical protein